MGKYGLLVLALCWAVAGYAAPRASSPGLDARIQSVRNLKLPVKGIDLNKENKFGDTPVFEAAKIGNVPALRSFERMSDGGAYLLKKGKNGNNVLHAARNLETFEALLVSIRYFYPSDYKEKTYALLEQRNNAEETPLCLQLNYGRTDIFAKYFKFTVLYDRIVEAKADLDRGGLAAEMAQYKINRILQEATNAAGVTLLQMAKQHAGKDVVGFFQTQAPYMPG